MQHPLLPYSMPFASAICHLPSVVGLLCSLFTLSVASSHLFLPVSCDFGMRVLLEVVVFKKQEKHRRIWNVASNTVAA